MMTSAEIDALWSIDDPVAGYAALQEALAQHPDSADEIHTQIARSLGLQGRFDEAWQALRRVSENPTPLVTVRVALEAGRLKNSSGDRKASTPYFHESLDRAVAGGFDSYAVDAAHMLGIVEEGDAAVRWNEQALALAANSTDPRAQQWRGSLLNNLGWTYHDRGDYEKALDLFTEVVAFREQQGNPVRTRIARWAVARCLRSLKRHEDALAILTGLAQFPEVGYVSQELGQNLLALGRADEAAPHLQRARELLSA